MLKGNKFSRNHQNRLSASLGSTAYAAAFASGNYTIELHEVPAPIKECYDMFVVTCDTDGNINHYEVKTDLLIESIEMIKGMKLTIATNFPDLHSTYTNETAYELVAHKSTFATGALSRLQYTRVGGYSEVFDDDAKSDAFYRAREAGLIPFDSNADDYTLLERFGKPTYFAGYGPGEKRALPENNTPFVRTYYNSIRLFKHGKVVYSVKPDERYQVCHGHDSNPLLIFDVVTDRRGNFCTDIKKGSVNLPSTLVDYLLDTIKSKY